MTFEQCHANLMAIRRRQGTRCPAVKVAYNGTVYQGRLTRADSDPEYPPGRGLALRRARPGEPRPGPGARDDPPDRQHPRGRDRRPRRRLIDPRPNPTPAPPSLHGGGADSFFYPSPGGSIGRSATTASASPPLEVASAAASRRRLRHPDIAQGHRRPPAGRARRRRDRADRLALGQIGEAGRRDRSLRTSALGGSC